MVAQAFSPSTREVEMGRDMAGQREEYKAGGDKSSGQFETVSLRMQPGDWRRQNRPFGLSTGRGKRSL